MSKSPNTEKSEEALLRKEWSHLNRHISNLRQNRRQSKCPETAASFQEMIDENVRRRSAIKEEIYNLHAHMRTYRTRWNHKKKAEKQAQTNSESTNASVKIEYVDSSIVEEMVDDELIEVTHEEEVDVQSSQDNGSPQPYASTAANNNETATVIAADRKVAGIKRQIALCEERLRQFQDCVFVLEEQLSDLREEVDSMQSCDSSSQSTQEYEYYEQQPQQIPQQVVVYPIMAPTPVKRKRPELVYF